MGRGHIPGLQKATGDRCLLSGHVSGAIAPRRLVGASGEPWGDGGQATEGVDADALLGVAEALATLATLATLGPAAVVLVGVGEVGVLVVGGGGA